ncbi:MAG: DUF1353 domain-containing protein [Gammaproteobacteria bacterium]|nr:DUF1353 domain-containing protein [Gammaproteobacteria bacterium]
MRNADQPPYQPVTVPIGFVTDFASIPRVFWSLLPPDGNYTYPAVIHDYLYWEQTTTREVADDILRLSMLDFKIDAVTLRAIYSGVRVGGQFAWNENARLKLAGERRILKRLPDDPTVSWEIWKQQPNVF